MVSARSYYALSFLSFFLATVQTGFGPFVSVWLTESSWSQADVGVALSVGTLAGLLGQLPAGALIDAIQRKRAVAAMALAGLAVSALLLALWPVRVPVWGAQVLHGLASCVLVPVVAALTLALVGHDGFAERVGINARYASIGNALTAALLGLWATYMSQRGVLLLTAALVLPTLLALAAIRARDLNPEPEPEPDEDIHAACLPPGQRIGQSSQLLRERGFIAFAACAMLFSLANAAMLPLALNIYVAHGNDTDWIISATIIVPQFVVACVAPFIGRAANFWGRRQVLLVGFIALPLRGLLFAVLPDPLLLIPAQLLDGISAAVFGIMLPLVAADVSRRIGCLNLAIGGLNLAVGVGATLSTTLAGALADAGGARTAFLALSAAGALATLLVWIVMPETRPPPRIPRSARAVVAA